jgi:hypothetical protein
MTIPEYVYAWTGVTGVLCVGSLAAGAVWCLWAGLSSGWRKRRAPKAKPAPAAAVEPTCAVAVITRMDRINADLADRRILWEIEDAFNQQGHA